MKGEMEMQKTIGDRIKEERKRLGLTQLELANKIGVTDRAVSKWEQKEGNPDVGLLPSLSSILGVTLDYLLTGKTVEEKVVFASKMEVCAKNDDLSLFKEIKDESIVDESRKSLMDYVIEYKSKNVFKAIIESQRPYGYFGPRQEWKYWGIDVMLNMFIISGCLNQLQKINWNINDVDPKEYNNESIDFILSEKCPEETKEIVFSCKAVKNPKWQDIYKEFMNRAIDKNNSFGIDIMFKLYESLSLAIPLDSLKKMLEKEMTDKLLEGNKYNTENGFVHIEKKEIEVLVMKQDESKTPEEVFIFSCIDNGILQIEKLLTCNNTKLIEKTLGIYPVTAYEVFNNLAEKKDVKGLFRLCIDNDLVASYGQAGTVDASEFTKSTVDYDKILKAIFKRLEDDLTNRSSYSRHIPICQSQVPNDIYIRDQIMRNCHSGFSTPNELLVKVSECKAEIISDLKLQDDKNRTTGDLTAEYFENQMKAGNYEIVVVKLCTKLEAILKADFKKEGDLKAMLDSYCKDIPDDDDGWGYPVESPMVNLLNKLRMKRNNIVHAEQNKVDLTKEELQKCIKYILDIERK
jgi:transcriptional regulator with XRE-family HTH domain